MLRQLEKWTNTVWPWSAPRGKWPHRNRCAAAVGMRWQHCSVVVLSQIYQRMIAQHVQSAREQWLLRTERQLDSRDGDGRRLIFERLTTLTCSNLKHESVLEARCAVHRRLASTRLKLSSSMNRHAGHINSGQPSFADLETTVPSMEQCSVEFRVIA